MPNWPLLPSRIPHPSAHPASSASDADRNWRRFVWFRVLFNARFYYPVLAILFLDLGLSATQYTLLNFAWALAIVASDLPAGVLADRLGRRPLVVAAAVSMVVEMVLLCAAPLHGGTLLFLCCLANRLLSGTAEGMASGADEALVFDSLAERGREKEWPRVLDQVTRWQSLGFRGHRAAHSSQGRLRAQHPKRRKQPCLRDYRRRLCDVRRCLRRRRYPGLARHRVSVRRLLSDIASPATLLRRCLAKRSPRNHQRRVDRRPARAWDLGCHVHQAIL